MKTMLSKKANERENSFSKLCENMFGVFIFLLSLSTHTHTKLASKEINII